MKINIQKADTCVEFQHVPQGTMFAYYLSTTDKKLNSYTLAIKLFPIVHDGHTLNAVIVQKDGLNYPFVWVNEHEKVLTVKSLDAEI